MDIDWIGLVLMTTYGERFASTVDGVRQQSQWRGCWWDATQPDSDDDCEVYLQLEHDKLCFKISICEQHINSAAHFRDRFSDTVLTAGTASGLHIKRPDRFGRGTWMTVAVLDRDYRAPVGASKVDWSYVQGIIGAADKVLKNAARQFPVV